MQSLTTQTFLVGFNATASKSYQKSDNFNETFGYDWKLLSQNMHLSCKSRHAKFGMDFYDYIVSCDQLPNILFYDLTYGLSENILPKTRNSMRTFKLDDYLNVFNLPTKNDMDFAVFHNTISQNRITDEFILKFVDYGLNDVIVSKQLMQHMKLLDIVVSQSQNFKVSIIQRLTETTAKIMSASLYIYHYDANMRIPSKHIKPQEDNTEYGKLCEKYIIDFKT